MPDGCMDVQTCLAWKIICSSPTSFVMLVLRSPFNFSTGGKVWPRWPLQMLQSLQNLWQLSLDKLQICLNLRHLAFQCSLMCYQVMQDSLVSGVRGLTHPCRGLKPTDKCKSCHKSQTKARKRWELQKLRMNPKGQWWIVSNLATLTQGTTLAHPKIKWALQMKWAMSPPSHRMLESKFQTNKDLQILHWHECWKNKMTSNHISINSYHTLHGHTYYVISY
jgi:hypothetical protein